MDCVFGNCGGYRGVYGGSFHARFGVGSLKLSQSVGF
jgi:hypothetical protein